MISKGIVKPWGHYEDIYRSTRMTIKKLVIKPGQSLSLQYHNKREEFWGVESGQGEMTLGETTFQLLPRNHIHILLLQKHRVRNTSDKLDLVIYETQIGVCDENDIVRIEDDYGR